MKMNSNYIDYSKVGNFIEFLHTNIDKIPNIQLGVCIEVNNYVAAFYIDIFYYINNIFTNSETIIISAPALEIKDIKNNMKIRKVTEIQYSKIIEYLKSLYTTQNLEIDYKYIGDFMIELNKVIDIDISDIDSLLVVGE